MKTIIEINGRKYDARTGKLLNTNSAIAQQKHSGVNSGLIDGYSQHKPAANINNMPTKPKQYKPLASSNGSGYKSIDIVPAHRKVQKSKTLVRAAVKKPVNKSSHMHATTAASVKNPENYTMSRGMLLKRVPIRRLEHALHSSKSALVNRYERTSKIKPKLDAKFSPAPEPQKINPTTAAPIIVNNNRHVFNSPNVNYHSAKGSKNQKVKIRTKISNNFSFNRKIVAILAAAVAIIVLSSFFAYQHVPFIGMRIAANKAGFSGKFPRSTPAGYTFKGPIEANRGNIVLTFKSNSDERKFVVSQKPTSWTSESLLTNYLVDSKLRYQTFYDKGLTVYIYNESNATWVDKGIWYSVKGDGSLSSEQILEIASSI